MNKEEFVFEDAMKRLEFIAAELEKEDISIDASIKLFEEGLELSKKCQATLETYEERVKELVHKHQGE